MKKKGEIHLKSQINIAEDYDITKLSTSLKTDVEYKIEQKIEKKEINEDEVLWSDELITKVDEEIEETDQYYGTKLSIKTQIDFSRFKLVQKPKVKTPEKKRKLLSN